MTDIITNVFIILYVVSFLGMGIGSVFGVVSRILRKRNVKRKFFNEEVWQTVTMVSLALVTVCVTFTLIWLSVDESLLSGAIVPQKPQFTGVSQTLL